MSMYSDPSSTSASSSAVLDNAGSLPAAHDERTAHEERTAHDERTRSIHPDLAALMVSGVASGLTATSIPAETADEIFEQLILPESDIMFRVALSLTHNRADAEDLVQESLLRAYKAIRTFDGRYPRAWVLTIVRNTERNRHRRRRPQLLTDPEIPDDLVPASSADAVELRAEYHELGGAIAQAVATLPLNFRQVVQLVDIDGLTYQEAAELVEVPLGTVMSRLHRARRRLRELLIPQGFGPEESSRESRAVPGQASPPRPDQALFDKSLSAIHTPSLVAGQPYLAGSALTEELRKASADAR
ncbi:MAG: sigma-70 family RNA polymerase sigma factor [Actinobacteria bacterium]|nr:sigma-70 family RNA polymerase sigma factor [Actinomycetota bacterium]